MGQKIQQMSVPMSISEVGEKEATLALVFGRIIDLGPGQEVLFDDFIRLTGGQVRQTFLRRITW